MKSKHRKNRNSPSPRRSSFSKTLNRQFSVKFEISKSNISCFIDPSRTLKCRSRPKQKNSRAPHRKESEPKQAYLLQSTAYRKNQRKDSSPDILQESSNAILSKIEEKGTSYYWLDNENNDQREEEQDQPIQSASIWTNFPEFNDSLDKSYASTNDYYMYQSNYKWEINETFSNTPYQVPPAITLHVSNNFIINPRNFQKDWRTTVMIRNIPNKYSINELADQIDTEHNGIYDFLYLPCDIKNQCNVGYGFINFINTKYMRSFYEKFHHYSWNKYRSEKICALAYARLQGLNQLIEHFQNSKVLNQKDKRYRPIIKFDHIHKIVKEQQSR